MPYNWEVRAGWGILQGRVTSGNHCSHKVLKKGGQIIFMNMRSIQHTCRLWRFSSRGAEKREQDTFWWADEGDRVERTVHKAESWSSCLLGVSCSLASLGGLGLILNHRTTSKTLEHVLDRWNKYLLEKLVLGRTDWAGVLTCWSLCFRRLLIKILALAENILNVFLRYV